MLDKRPYDLWAEVPSPIKTRLRNAFTAYAKACFQKDGILPRSYIPAQVGGNMPKEEYLREMTPESLPDACFLMDFGECSENAFAALAEKVYEKPETRAWFPEVMAIDLKRLGSRKLPETYDDLLKEEYRGEICLIGNRKLPDPLAGLYLFRKYGEEGLKAFVRNVASFAPPSETIRHIGRPSNSYGSIFLMPPLFAQICLEKPAAKVVIPKTGAVAEPMLLYQKPSAQAKEKVRTFFYSDTFCNLMADYQMPVFEDRRFRIDRSCEKLATAEELEIVFHAFIAIQ